jgi:nucleoside-diphosphate-sugar epimerase
LSNISRHDLPVHLVSYPDLARQGRLEGECDVIVNFAHPFSPRDGLSVDRQIDILCDLFADTLAARPDCRLIHVSTMSVYEPFLPPDREFTEGDPLRPPKDDLYARAKVRFDRKLLSRAEITERVLIVRPTVIYGPFCRPWTDRVMEAFLAGDVPFVGLGGRMQPVLGRDVSRFIRLNLREFRAGVYNLAPAEPMSWHDFLSTFESIVGRGRLVQIPKVSAPRKPGLLSPATAMRAVGILARDPGMKELLRPHYLKLPPGMRGALKERFLSEAQGMAGSPGREHAGGGPYCRAFFAQDRLLSMRALAARFPEFECSPLIENRELLERYFRFRFTDDLPI